MPVSIQPCLSMLEINKQTQHNAKLRYVDLIYYVSYNILIQTDMVYDFPIFLSKVSCHHDSVPLATTEPSDECSESP